jgi:predicted enzyme related to lactoylglutathione lyase
MQLELLNAVVQAEDYDSLRDWYVDALELEVAEEHSATFHYAELARDGKVLFGIASAEEMGVDPPRPRRNAVVAQLRVSDAAAVLVRVKERGGKVPFGPTHDENGKYTYGGFEDLEGNLVWVFQPPT